MNAQDKKLDGLLGELDQILPNFLALRGIVYFGVIGRWTVVRCRGSMYVSISR